MTLAEPEDKPEDKPRERSSRRVRTPTVLQMEAVECGAACLAIILAYFGRWVTLEELRVATGVSRDGAKASNVVKAARGYGLEAKGHKSEVDEALAFRLPFTVFWNFNHFVVVEGHDRKYVYINDPAIGPRKVTMEEFGQSFTGIVLDMRPGPDFKKGGERRSLIKSLKPQLRGSELALTFVVLASLMLVIPGLLLPAFLKAFVDDVLILDHGSWLFPLLVGLALAGIVNGILTYLQQRYLLRIQTKLGTNLSGKFFWHVLKVPVVFYTQRYVGDVAARVASCHRLAALLSGSLSTSVVNGMMVVFYAVVMFLYSMPLTIITVVLALINVGALQLVRRKLKDLNSHLLNQQAKLSGASMAGLQAIETLKATGTENDFFGIWAGYQTSSINTNQELSRVSLKLDMVPGLINAMTVALILGAGGLLIIDGQLTIGGLVAFQSLMGYFTGPIRQLVGFGSQLQEIEGDLNRLDDVMRYETDYVFKADDTYADSPAKSEPAPKDAASRAGKLSGALEMRNVCFAYSPLDPPLIKDFSLSLSPGRRVAFVGGTGSGKTTLAKLVLGLIRPNSGEILYDGMAIEDIPRSVFTSSVGAVDQDIFLFEGNVSNNLTMWDSTIHKGEVVRAAKDACVHDVISERSGGYESRVAEGNANFSGGQAQRLEIARALVSNPTLLVLDEATASLDPLTEKTVDDNIRRRGCTCVIIAHRLSTIRDSDEIIVLDHGKIVERGTHDALVANKGHYAELVTLQ